MKSLEEYLRKELEENKETFEDNLLYRYNVKKTCLSRPSQEELLEEIHQVYTRLNRIKEFPNCFQRGLNGKPYISPQAHISMELGYVSCTPQGFELTQKGEEKLQMYQHFLFQDSIQYH